MVMTVGMSFLSPNQQHESTFINGRLMLVNSKVASKATLTDMIAQPQTLVRVEQCNVLTDGVDGDTVGVIDRHHWVGWHVDRPEDAGMREAVWRSTLECQRAADLRPVCCAPLGRKRLQNYTHTSNVQLDTL